MSSPFAEYLKNFSSNNISWQSLVHMNEYNGLASAGTLELINKAVEYMDKDKCYLEVGIYQACNLVGVATKNSKFNCYGVDNFEQEFKENRHFEVSTEEVVKQRLENLRNCYYFNEDFRKFLKDRKEINGQKVGVYFYDGPHSYLDQIDGIEMAFGLFEEEAFIFIDDLLSENVQKAINDLLKKHDDHLLELGRFNEGGKSKFNQGLSILYYKR